MKALYKITSSNWKMGRLRKIIIKLKINQIWSRMSSTNKRCHLSDPRENTVRPLFYLKLQSRIYNNHPLSSNPLYTKYSIRNVFRDFMDSHHMGQDLT